jgi:hypothetical protein
MSPESGFLLQHQIVPRLQSAIPSAVPFIGSEDVEELVQDGTCIAARMMHNAENNGKRVVQSANNRGNKGNQGKKVKQVTAGNVAYYVIVKLRNGCRSNGFVTGDVYGTGTQINGRTRLTSLEEVVATDEETGGEILLHDVLAADQEDPATKATRKLDWETFMAGLSDRDQAIIQFMAEGRSLANLARTRGFNSSTLSYCKDRIAKAIADFMGPGILVDIQRRPQWKDGIEAAKERMAVRYDRGR